MKLHYNRREFLSAIATNGTGILILSNCRSARAYDANDKLNIAIIGAGGRGVVNLDGVKTEHIVALCDADERRAAPSFAKYPQAAKYFDYRALLDKMDRGVDAVVVSTPNHVHAPATVKAMRMGKHAYCEKPLSHSVHEARLAADTAKAQKVATQMGTQIHATDNYRRIVELIRAGAIGQVRECHCWLRGGGSAGNRPKETPPVPAGLHWDLWLAVAPNRPYHPCYVPHDWHYWWDFGGGAFGNMGCHYFDLAFWALELRHPTTIEADGPAPHQQSTPAWQHVKYQFPQPDGRPPILLTWTHGKEPPKVFADNSVPPWAWGVFIGNQGALAVNYTNHALLPEKKFKDFQPPEPNIQPSEGHYKEWIKACKTGSPTLCNFDYSGAITEAMLLGNIAYRTGQKLDWDSETMTFPDCPAANTYLQRDYRDGWEL